MGIPHNPTEQGNIEHTYATLKTLLKNKQKKGECNWGMIITQRYYLQIAKALFTFNFMILIPW